MIAYFKRFLNNNNNNNNSNNNKSANAIISLANKIIIEIVTEKKNFLIT